MVKQMQFELWQECNSKCKFCYLGFCNNKCSSEEKIKTMNFVLNKISDLSIYPEFDTIAFLGGEFFQGQMSDPLVKEKFMELMEKVNWLKENHYIKNVWIYATLTIGDQKDLYETLEKFSNKENFWVLTSYDTMGRFHTQKMEDNWKFHMKKIHELYHFITKYLKNEYNMEKFMNEYNTLLYFKVPNRHKDRFITNIEMNNAIGNFFPTRHQFLQFLTKVKTSESIDIWNRLFDINLRADKLYCKHDNQIKESTRDKTTYMELYDKNFEHIMDCGHLSVYNIYTDCDGCALCDKQMIEELI